MKKVSAKATWRQQETRPGQIGRIGNAVNEALQKAFDELGLNCLEVECRGDVDDFGLHFIFTEKEKKPEPAPVAKPAPVEKPAEKESFLKKASVKWKSKPK